MSMMQPGSVLQAIDIGSVAHNVIEGIKDFEHPVLTGREWTPRPGRVAARLQQVHHGSIEAEHVLRLCEEALPMNTAPPCDRIQDA